MKNCNLCAINMNYREKSTLTKSVTNGVECAIIECNLDPKVFKWYQPTDLFQVIENFLTYNGKTFSQYE